ncbi:hypothetical protein [Borrelia hermsii]|uniref:BBK32-like protein n=2 Tax=Borrelia hermsii TaxID=140 RepID=Q5MBA1_BORHE|nr:hypothetical protein [Borrelia hermsii]AAV88064.1 BBK32-like protein [Borrelia hermsii]ANA43954.1 BBK32-like protein [Borrelia hermsii HS1]UPA08413.1 hypothetical protein bhDAH_001072 [Borrelia hermsii DAH]
MKSKTKYLSLSLLLSFISCDLLFNGELKDKSVDLLGKIYSVLDTSKETVNPSDNAHQNSIPKKSRKNKRHTKKDQLPQRISGFTKKGTLQSTEGETNFPSLSGISPVGINYNARPDNFKNTSSSNYLQGNEIIDSNSLDFSYDSAYSLSGQNSFSQDYYEEDEDDYNYNNYDQEDEDEEDDDNYGEYEDEDDKEEARLDKEYKSRSRKTKNSVKKALEIARQIRYDWGTVEFLTMKLDPNYGIRSTKEEKQEYQEKLSKFNKNKLTEDLTKLLSAIEESLNDAIALTNIPEYPGSFQSDLDSKTKLEKLKTEISSLLAKVQVSHKTNYQAYKEIESPKRIPPQTKYELKKVLRLLDGTTGAR